MSFFCWTKIELKTLFWNICGGSSRKHSFTVMASLTADFSYRAHIQRESLQWQWGNEPSLALVSLNLTVSGSSFHPAIPGKGFSLEIVLCYFICIFLSSVWGKFCLLSYDMNHSHQDRCCQGVSKVGINFRVLKKVFQLGILENRLQNLNLWCCLHSKVQVQNHLC